MMVTFDICAGNPGALQFLMQAYDMDMFKAEQGFQRCNGQASRGHACICSGMTVATEIRKRRCWL